MSGRVKLKIAALLKACGACLAVSLLWGAACYLMLLPVAMAMLGGTLLGAVAMAFALHWWGAFDFHEGRDE